MSVFTRGFWARLLTRGFWQGDYTPPVTPGRVFEHYVATVDIDTEDATGTLGYVRALSECPALTITATVRVAVAGVGDPPPYVSAVLDHSNPLMCVLTVDIVALAEDDVEGGEVIIPPTWLQVRNAMALAGFELIDGGGADTDPVDVPNSSADSWTYENSSILCVDAALSVATRFVPLVSSVDADTPPNNLGDVMAVIGPIFSAPCEDNIFGEPYTATVDVEAT